MEKNITIKDIQEWEKSFVKNRIGNAKIADKPSDLLDLIN